MYVYTDLCFIFPKERKLAWLHFTNEYMIQTTAVFVFVFPCEEGRL